MSSSATRQPSARNRFAVASPMPRAAPVTSATFCGAATPYPFIVCFTCSINCLSVKGFGRNANFSPAGRLFSNASSA